MTVTPLLQAKTLTGVPRSYETPLSYDPTVGLYLGSYGGPMGGGLFLMSEVLL